MLLIVAACHPAGFYYGPLKPGPSVWIPLQPMTTIWSSFLSRVGDLTTRNSSTSTWGEIFHIYDHLPGVVVKHQEHIFLKPPITMENT